MSFNHSLNLLRYLGENMSWLEGSNKKNAHLVEDQIERLSVGIKIICKNLPIGECIGVENIEK